MYHKLRENQILYCVDEDQELMVRGANNFNYTRLDLQLTLSEEFIQSNKTLQDVQSYLSAPELYILKNDQVFNNIKYPRSVVRKESSILATHLDTSQPYYMEARIENSVVMDEVGIFKFGQTENTDFYKITIDKPVISFIRTFPTNY